MARIHDPIKISSGVHPSLGVLIGSRVSGDVFDNINSHGHASFFGSEFDVSHQQFLDHYVRPMDEISFDISRTVNMLINPDRIRLLDTMEDFQSTPSCMEMAILLYQPVRDLAEQGRIEGYGWNVDTLPDDDIYGRLIDNFTCEDVAEASDDEGYYDIQGTLYSDDLDLNDDDLYAIRKTRDFIRDKILKETNRDPTAIGLSRG